MTYSFISEDEICKVLALKPDVFAMVDASRKYFGTKLEIKRTFPWETGSGVEPEWLNSDDHIPKGFTVRIKMDSPRVAAHIAHEFLHLKIIMDGFPWGKCMRTSDKEETEWLFQTLYGMLNEVQHLIFFENFLNFGFQSEEFLEAPDYSCDPIKFCADLEIKCSDPKWSKYARGMWNQRYLSEYISGRQGFSNFSGELVRLGKNLPFPIGGEVIFMQEWVDRGDYKSKDRYADALNELLGKIGFPIAEFIPLNFP